MKNYYKIDELYYPYAFISERHICVECIRHMHISPEIVIVEDGELNMYIGERSYSIKGGEGVFIPPFAPHSFSSPNYNVCHVFTFAKELLAHISDFVKTNAVKNHLFTIPKPLLALINHYLPKKQNRIESTLAQAILSPLYHEITSGCEFVENESAADDTLICALKYMTAHYDTELTLDTVAASVGIHPVTLSRFFTERTGITFTHFVKYLRASRAEALIRNTTDTFTSIALSCGFGSVRSFNRVFYELYGVTPGECRKGKNRSNVK